MLWVLNNEINTEYQYYIYANWGGAMIYTLKVQNDFLIASPTPVPIPTSLCASECQLKILSKWVSKEAHVYELCIDTQKNKYVLAMALSQNTAWK